MDSEKQRRHAFILRSPDASCTRAKIQAVIENCLTHKDEPKENPDSDEPGAGRDNSSEDAGSEFRVYFPLPHGLFPRRDVVDELSSQMAGLAIDEDRRSCDAVVDFANPEAAAKVHDKLQLEGIVTEEIPFQVFSETVCELNPDLLDMLTLTNDIQGVMNQLVEESGIEYRMRGNYTTINGNQWNLDIARYLLEQWVHRTDTTVDYNQYTHLTYTKLLDNSNIHYDYESPSDGSQKRDANHSTQSSDEEWHDGHTKGTPSSADAPPKSYDHSTTAIGLSTTMKPMNEETRPGNKSFTDSGTSESLLDQRMIRERDTVNMETTGDSHGLHSRTTHEISTSQIGPGVNVSNHLMQEQRVPGDRVTGGEMSDENKQILRSEIDQTSIQDRQSLNGASEVLVHQKRRTSRTSAPPEQESVEPDNDTDIGDDAFEKKSNDKLLSPEVLNAFADDTKVASEDEDKDNAIRANHEEPNESKHRKSNSSIEHRDNMSPHLEVKNKDKKNYSDDVNLSLPDTNGDQKAEHDKITPTNEVKDDRTMAVENISRYQATSEDPNVYAADRQLTRDEAHIAKVHQHKNHGPTVTTVTQIYPVRNSEEVHSDSFPLKHAVVQFIMIYYCKALNLLMEGRKLHTSQSHEKSLIDVCCVSHAKDDAECYFEKFMDYYQDIHELLWTEELEVSESDVHVLSQYLKQKVSCIVGHPSNGKLIVTCEAKSRNDALAIIDNICTIKDPDHMKHPEVSESESSTKTDDASSSFVHQNQNASNDREEHGEKSSTNHTHESESTTKTDDMSSSSVHKNAPIDLEEQGHTSSDKTNTNVQKSSDKTNTSGQKSSHKRDTSGQKSSDKTNTSGHTSSDKTNTSGQMSSDKTNTSGQKSSDKTNTSGHTSSDKTNTSGQMSSDKTNTSGQMSSDKTNTSGQMSSDKMNTSGARPKHRGHDIRSEHVIVNPLYWKYIETHEVEFMRKLKEQLVATNVEMEADCDKLILAGQNHSSLSVVKNYIQKHYDAFAFNLKNVILTSKRRLCDLCVQFPDVVFVRDDSGKMNAVGLSDNIDSCIMTLSRGTQPHENSENMGTSQSSTKSKQPDTFPVEEDILHFLKVHCQNDLRKVNGRYVLHCTENTDTDDCVNVRFTDRSGNSSEEQLNKFILFYQDVYTTIAQETFSLGAAVVARIESEFKAMGVLCLLKEISSGTFKATYYSEQKQVIRDIVRQIAMYPTSTGAPSMHETGINSYVSSGPLTVRLPSERASNTVTAGTGSRHATPYGHHPSGFIIHNKIEVFIHKCDITKLHVDAVVNAANNGLYHGGGVARAISKAAGPELDKEGKHYVSRHGKLAESMVAVTTGGNMPCAKVIHAVGPQWPKWPDQHKERRCLTLLYETFKNIIEESTKCGFRSLAMPAVSSGIYGVPQDEVANSICASIVNLGRHMSLQEIHLVDVTDAMLNMMSVAFLQKVNPATMSPGDVIELDTQTVESAIQKRTCVIPKGFLIHDKVQIFIHTCDITTLKVDVIVCSADPELLCATGLAKVIADKAGKDFKDTCRKYARAKKLDPSDVIPMPAGNLPVIFHAVAPRFKGSWRHGAVKNEEGTFKELLSTMFYNALQKARAANLQTLALPPIGAAQEGVQKEWVAKELCQALLDGLRGEQTIKVIHIVDIRTDILDAIVREIIKQNDPCVKPIAHDIVQMETSHGVGSNSGGAIGGEYARGSAPARQSSADRFGDNSRNSGHSYASVTSGRTASMDPVDTNRSIQNAITSRGITSIGQSNASGAMPLTGSTSTSGAGVDPNTVIHSSNYRKNRSAGGQSNTPATTSSTSPTAKSDEKDICVICMTDPINPKVLQKCKHIFCTSCIDECFKKCGPKCPSCGEMYGALTGNQPKNGRMTVSRSGRSLPGYEKYGSITISYMIPRGKQGSEHPNPGQTYTGTSRTAYLPDNKEGEHVLKLLQRAFDARLTFTIGKSSTTGHDNMVVWNDIHHKTTVHGGQQNYGYPDPTYLSRVQQELAVKGIK